MASKIDVFIVIVGFALVSCLSASVIRSGSIIVTYDGVNLKCDKFTCPQGTVHCKVTRKTLQDDTTQVERHGECYGDNREILHEETFKESNPNPGTSINVMVEKGKFGSSSSSGSSSSQFRPNLFGSSGNPSFGPNQNPSLGPNEIPSFGPNQNPSFGPNQNPSFGPNQNPSFGTNQNPSFGPNQNPSSNFNNQFKNFFDNFERFFLSFGRNRS